MKEKIILLIFEPFIILKDSLTGPDNKYSSKKLTMFVSFIVAIVMGFIDQLTIHKANLVIFDSFMAASLGMAGLSAWLQKKGIKTPDEANIDTNKDLIK